VRSQTGTIKQIEKIIAQKMFHMEKTPSKSKKITTGVVTIKYNKIIIQLFLKKNI
jgi:hypothetical protein